MEHRDRLARFGVEHVEAALAAQGRRIVVADAGKATDDPVRDVIEALTACALVCAGSAVRATGRCARSRQPNAIRGEAV